METTPVDSTLYPPPLFPPEEPRRARQAEAPEPVDLQTRIALLTDMGWEGRRVDCYWLMQRGHRRIQLFLDGRVVLLDPTIKARYQFDEDWLAAIRIVGADRRF
jgi:hypothetical protein